MTSRSGRSSNSADSALSTLYREEWGRLLSLLVARTRRIDLVEDALSEAFARAADRWPSSGLPDRPAGWLYTTAYRLIIDRRRAEAVAGRYAPRLAVRPSWEPPNDPTAEFADDRLDLILLCCHPALPTISQSALALRLVIGTPTDQIARLFLVSTATMAARITRAKAKIVTAGIPLGTPVSAELPARLDEVCRTIYLAFTAGYAPGSGADLARIDLAGDALRLADVLHSFAPDADQVRALLALLLLQHSRRDARAHDGRLVPLADQDRSLWHADEIKLGLDLIASLSPTTGYAEQLRREALIAAAHASTIDGADTDWAEIAGHYAALESMTGSAIIRLNRAVAVAEVDGPRAGLALLAELGDTLKDHHRFAAVCGELALRAGDDQLAAASFEAAVELCDNEVERAYLSARQALVDDGE